MANLDYIFYVCGKSIRHLNPKILAWLILLGNIFFFLKEQSFWPLMKSRPGQRCLEDWNCCEDREQNPEDVSVGKKC